MTAIGPYEVSGELGRGGNARVFRARDSTGQDVAIKLLTVGRTKDSVARRRFQRELEALLRLRHENIVGFRGAGEHAGRPYLVMDLVQGESLEERLKRGPLRASRAAEVALRLARALQHAHDNGILHRDLKPANVLLTPDGTPLLTDFGLVRDIDGEQSRLSLSGAFLGTPGYWPPEQAAGQLAEIGPRSDVYSLGATLYAALTGEAPLIGSSMLECIGRTLKGSVRPPSSHDGAIHEGLDAICLRCLQKRPEDRYPDVAALADDLEGYLNGEALPSATPDARRTLAPLAVAAAAILLSAAGLVRWRAVGGAAAPPPTLPRPPEAAASQPPTTHRAPPPNAEAGVEVEVDSDAPAWCAEADRRATRGDRSAALKAWRRAVDLDPEDARALVGLGRAIEAKGDLLGAIRLASRALLQPTLRHQALRLRADARFRLGDLLGAVKDGLEAVGRRPADVDGLMMLARVGVVARDYQGALVQYEKALGALNLDDPRRTDVRRERELAKRGLAGDRVVVPSAWVSVDRATAGELEPPLTQAKRWREEARARAKAGDREGELDALNRTLQIDPTYAEAYDRRGQARVGVDGWRPAIRDYNRALLYDPTVTKVLHSRGWARYMLGDYAGALTDCDLLIEAGAASTLTRENRILVLGAMGDYAGAIAQAQDVLRRYGPDHERAPFTRKLLARFEEARETSGASEAQQWFLAGFDRAKRGMGASAIVAFNRALEIDPKLRVAYFGRGRVLALQGRHNKAIADFRRALDLMPDGARFEADVRAAIAKSRQALQESER